MTNKLMISEQPVPQVPTLYENGGSLAVSLARAEVDQQITTARAYPRGISRAIEHILTLATLDENTAAKCIYALPRKNESGEDKLIKGPSIRLAEIVASQWGNCRVGSRIVHVDRFEKYIEAEGVFHDLETNMATTSRVRRRISTKKGYVFSDDMIIVTGNAACAIAKRNAIFAAVPRGIWGKAYDAVEQVIAGDIKTLSKRRMDAIKTITAKYNISIEQVFRALEVDGEDDIDLERLSMLTAMRTSLSNGEATVDELFPKEPPKNGGPKGLDAKLDAIAAGDKPYDGTEGTLRKDAANNGVYDPETGEIIDLSGSHVAVARALADPTGEEAARQLAAKLKERALAANSNPSHGRPDPDAKVKDAGARPPDAPASDPILDAGRAAATNGATKYMRWENNLSAPDFERIKPHIKEMRKVAGAPEWTGA